VSVYIVNEGEKEALKAVLLQGGLVVGLYKNQIIPDGNTIFASLEEMPTGGGRGYAPVVLTNDMKEGVAAADWWTMLVNAFGKAEGVYDDAALEWTFLAPDVADVNTVYGAFGYTLVLAFTAGLQPIKVGDVLRQGAVCAEVTGVNLTSGSWAAGTAAGNLYLKRQSGTFVAGATLVDVSKPTATSEIKVLTAAPVAAGTGYAVGDLFAIGTGTGGVGRVTAVTGGVVTAVELLTGGKDYTVATHATTKISGTGDNVLTVAVASLYTSGPAVTIATIAGDSSKKLIFVETLTTSILVEILGQKISYQPKLTMSTG
jgi:hypothetical protein